MVGVVDNSQQLRIDYGCANSSFMVDGKQLISLNFRSDCPLS